MIHSKRQKWVSILFSFVVMCVTAILGFVGLLQSAKPFSVLADDTTVAWELVTDASSLAVNDEVVIVAKDSDYALSTTQNSNNRGQAAITKNNDTITITDSVQILTIQVGKTDGTFAFYTGSGYLYAASSSKNHLKTETTLSDNSSWSITIESANGVATVKAQGTYTRNWLKYNNNGNGIFSCYSSGQQDIQLYKKVEAACAHKNLGNITVGTPNGDGKTHTITGTCASCGVENITKTVDCVAVGTVTYTPNREDDTHTETGTCVCGREFTSNSIPCDHTNGACACGNPAPSCIVTYSVWGTLTTVETTKGSYTLKTAEDFGFPASYGTFVGWAESEVSGSVSSLPAICTEYNLTGDKTFYAVFQGKGLTVGGYEKITENLSDWSGEYLIVYEDGNIAFNGALTKLDDTNNTVGVTIADNKISSTSELENSTFTIAAMDGGYSIQSKSGYYIGQTSTSNGLKSSLTSKYTNTISISNGTVSIQSSGATLKYNNTSNQNRFRYYKSGQQAIQLYKTAYVVTDVFYTKRAATIASASVSLDGDISMNYFAQVLDESVSSLQMRFTVGEGTPTVVDGVKQEDGRYKFTLSLTPQCMADNIRAELLNGEVCIDVKDGFSVREYAKTLFEDEESSDKLKALLSAMLRYGAAAQTYRNYNTEDLATRGVEDLLTAASATEIPEASFSLVKAEDVTKDDCAVWFKGAGIRFDSENKIYVRLSGALPEGYTLTCDGEAMTASADGYFYTAAISPTAYGNNYEFVLKNGGKVLQTLSGSINACLSMAANATGATDAEKALALALYNYGVAAEAYANA